MREPLSMSLLRATLWLLFRLFFRIEFEGRDNVPEQGACIVVPNHQTYLDPLFVGLGMRRWARYMAWDRIFRIPLLGWCVTRMGAFPVDVTRPDKSSYKQSLELLERSELLVVFPEGGRARRGRVEEFKPGVARLALATGAVLVPCTIQGGDRVWPPGHRLPRPGKIRVTYHTPMRVAAETLSDPEAEKARITEVLAALRACILSPLV